MQTHAESSRKHSTAGRLTTLAPFHLEATVRVLQRRPSNLVDVWDRDRYRRVLTTTGGPALVEVTNCGAIDTPDVRFVVRSPGVSAAMRSQIARSLRTMLGLDLDPEPMQTLALRERALRPTALALRGMRPPRFAGLFDAFANVIPFQQLSLDAGVAIVTRLVERFGDYIEHDGQRMSAFPTALAIAEARLPAMRACGLSSGKASSLRELARMIVSGKLTEAEISVMSTRDALSTLVGLPGIGPWSAALVLLRGFGRLDVFPPGDVGAMRGLRGLLHLGPHAPLGRIEARFGKHRGHLYFFALGGSLLAKGLIRAAPGQDAEPVSELKAVITRKFAINGR
ncbi:MAG: DNA-3-methyladenine glycosylase family protein [Steroidobacter sp.]